MIHESIRIIPSLHGRHPVLAHSSIAFKCVGWSFFLWLHYTRAYCVSDFSGVLKFLRYLTAFGAVCATLPTNQSLGLPTLPRERSVCMRNCSSRDYDWTGLRLLQLAIFGTCIRPVSSLSIEGLVLPYYPGRYKCYV